MIRPPSRLPDGRWFLLRRACVVVVVWSPVDRTPPRPAQDPPARLGAFDHWLGFTPDLTTSPTYRDALIAQLPT